jgi:OOP family OmpA-OmpF porin
MIRKAIATLAATASIALAATAGAEIRPKSYTLSPFFGGYTFEGDQNIKTNPVVGARLGYAYTKQVGVEALADYGKTQSKHQASDQNIHLWTAGVEGLYHFFPDSRIVPFVAGGARVVHLIDTGRQLRDRSDTTRAGLSYGVGAKLALTPEFGLRADVRHILLADQGWNNLEYTLGLTFGFGGKAAAPSPPPPPPPAPVVAPPPAAPTVSMSASPSSIDAGKCADLSWYSANATSVSIEPNIGTVPVNGTKQVCPTGSTTYTATASGPGGKASTSAPVNVVQPPPPPPPPAPAAPAVSISAQPASIQKGQCSNLGWSSSNASTVQIDQGIGAVQATGSKQVCPTATTSYTISGSGAGGTRTASTTVSVVEPPPPPAVPAVSISASPASIQKGQCSNLDWSSSNAATVSIDQGIGNVGATGSKQVCPTSNTSYTITGVGAGGTRTASTSVSVTAPPKEPTKEELTIVLAIEFDTAKSAIRKKYDPEVARVAEFMKKYPQVKGVIEGHTDNVGGKAYNEKLSLQRANAVKKQLVEKYGIDGSRLTTAGYGFSQPVADNKTEAGRQKNRRIVANFDKVTIVKP